MVSLFYVEVGDATERRGAHIDIGLGSDLSVPLTVATRSLVAALVVVTAVTSEWAFQMGAGNYAADEKHTEDDEQYFLGAHCSFLVAEASKHTQAIGLSLSSSSCYANT